MWNKVRKILSSDKNVSKFVFEKDTAVAEAVLYGYPNFAERTVICASTQSGCPVGCRFCGAGDNFVRSLTTEEIVDQAVRLIEETQVNPADIKRTQIMFMSMGEPLLNLAALCPAMETLYGKYPGAALLISTSAPRVDYNKVIEISQKIPTIGLQFSVHESTDEARDALIPFKQKLSLKEIAVEGERWYHAVGRRPFFNYCAHEKNSSADDADRILALFNPEIWEATISVVCERDESIAAANERQRKLATDFRALLGKRDFSTRVFDPAGQEDSCGCGQLWHVQQWMKNNPDKIKPSVGHRLPVLHSAR